MTIQPEDFILNQNIKAADIDYKQAEKLVNELKRLEYLTKSCYTVFDYFKNEFYYVSENTQFFKSPPSCPKKAYEFLLDNFHAEDFQIMHIIQQRAFAFLMKQKPQERTSFVISLNIRILYQGQKVDVCYSVKPEILDKKGNIWLSLSVIERPATFTKPLVVNTITGEQHFFKPLPITEFKSYTEQLTGKEMLILQNMANGLEIEKIGKIMRIKISTFKSHRNSIYKKLGVDSRLGAVNKAYIYGIIK